MGQSNQRIIAILNLLKKTYPDAKIVLRYGNPWELLVAVILSAQCTDVMVNKVTEKLFKKYPTLDDYVNAKVDEFEQDIKSTGFYHNKAKNVLAAAKLIKEKYRGKIPKTMAEMLTIPGVARKTANVVLGNAHGVVEGIAVDTHVGRVSQRLRLVNMEAIGGKKMIVDYKKDADPNKIEQELMGVVPKKDWFPFTYMIIDHGRAICKAKNPNCENCVLNKLCPSSRL